MDSTHLAIVTIIALIIRSAFIYLRIRYVEDTKVKLAKIEKDKELKLARYSLENRSVEETELET